MINQLLFSLETELSVKAFKAYITFQNQQQNNKPPDKQKL